MVAPPNPSKQINEWLLELRSRERFALVRRVVAHVHDRSKTNITSHFRSFFNIFKRKLTKAFKYNTEYL